MGKTSGLVLDERAYTGLVAPAAAFEDKSRFGNDGTHTAITWVQQDSGLWVRSFNGSTSKVVIGNTTSLQITSTFSVKAWGKTSDTGTLQYIAAKNGSWAGWVFGKEAADTFQFAIETSVGGNQQDKATSSSGYNDGKYHLFVGVFLADGSTGAKIYVDGADDTTQSGATLGVMSDPAVNVIIGQAPSNPDQRVWDDSISLFAIFNYVLSAQQIADIYDSERHYFER